MELFILSQVEPFKFGSEWVISSHTLPRMLLLIHAGIQVKPY